MINVQEVIAQAHREEWARVVAALAKRFDNLESPKKRPPRRLRPRL